jgi:hypothetical protein
MSFWKAFAGNKRAHLLATILLIFLSLPFAGHLHPRIPVLMPLLLLAVLFVLRTFKISRWDFWFTAALGALAFIAQALSNNFYASSRSIPLTLFVCFAVIIFLLRCILLMCVELFESPRVTLDTIMGGINIYFLLGIFWAYLYYLIFALDPGAFHFSSPASITYFFCYSFSTLTTIGFGDMYPVNHWAMIFSCLEGVSGQLCLGIFIARLIGLYVQEQGEKVKRPGAGV